MSESMCLAGLDVHQGQSVAAVLDPLTGELSVERLRGGPVDVVPAFLEGLGRPVRAVYEAGPAGFSLARVAVGRGLDLRVIAPGSIPRSPGDRVKTDRRDAKRLVRLFAAGELSFSYVPSEEEEHFRDLVRCIDDARKDLMRSRHRLSKFLLRRGLRFPGRSWTQPHQRWLGKISFDDAPSKAVFVDYCCAIDGLVHRRRELIGVLEDAVETSPHANTIARLRCFRSDQHADRGRSVRRGRQLRAVCQARTTVGVSRDRPGGVHLRGEARAGPDHESRPDPRSPVARRGRASLPARAARQPGARLAPERPGPACRRGLMASTAAPASALEAPRRDSREAHRDRRGRVRA